MEINQVSETLCSLAFLTIPDVEKIPKTQQFRLHQNHLEDTGTVLASD
jgi:hypothetical protein